LMKHAGWTLQCRLTVLLLMNTNVPDAKNIDACFWVFREAYWRLAPIDLVSKMLCRPVRW